MDKDSLVKELMKLRTGRGATLHKVAGSQVRNLLTGEGHPRDQLIALCNELGSDDKAAALRNAYGFGVGLAMTLTDRRENFAINLPRPTVPHADTIERWENAMILELAEQLLAGGGVDSPGAAAADDDPGAAEPGELGAAGDDVMPELDPVAEYIDDDNLPELDPLTEEEILAGELREALDREADLIEEIAEREAREVLDTAGWSDAGEDLVEAMAAQIMGLKEEFPPSTRFLSDEERTGLIRQLQSGSSPAAGPFDPGAVAWMEREVLDSARYTVEDWMEYLDKADLAEDTKRRMAESFVEYRRQHRLREPVQLDAATRRLLITLRDFVTRSGQEIRTQLDSQRVVSTAASDVIATAEEWKRETLSKRRPNRKQVDVATRLLDDARRLDSNAKALAGAARGHSEAITALGDEVNKFLKDADPATYERLKPSEDA